MSRRWLCVFAFAGLGALAGSPAAQADATIGPYQITYLAGVARDLNNHDQVTGSIGGCGVGGFVWQPSSSDPQGKYFTLAVLPLVNAYNTCNSAQGWSINDNGVVAGDSNNGNQSPYPGGATRAVEWKPSGSQYGPPIDLGILDGSCIVPTGSFSCENARGSSINLGGTIAGSSDRVVNSHLWFHGFVTGTSGLVDLQPPGQEASVNFAYVNDAGQLLEQPSPSNTNGSRLGGAEIPFHAGDNHPLNNHGVVVGYSQGGAFQPMLWDGSAHQLEHLPGTMGGEALGISDNGDVAGSAFSSKAGAYGFTAVVWHNGKPIDLNTLVPPGSPHIAFAYAINDKGTVIGAADFQPPGVAFVAQPVVLSNALPEIQLGDVSVPPPTTHDEIAKIPVTVTSHDTTITVEYATQNATAKAGRDYRAISGSLVFPKGTDQKLIDVTILKQPAIGRKAKTFTIHVQSTDKVNIPNPNATATIEGRTGVVTVQLTPQSIAGDGFGIVTATVTDKDRNGIPIAGAKVRIEPPPTYDPGVHALICDDANRLVYPSRLSNALIGSHFDRVTDGNGQIRLTMFVGTVGGSFLVSAGEPDASRSDWGNATLGVNASGGRGTLPLELGSILIGAGNNTLLSGGSLLRNVLTWLGGIKTGKTPGTSGGLAGIGFAPIWARDTRGQLHTGVVLFPETPVAAADVFNFLAGGGSGAGPDDQHAIVIDIDNTSKLLLGAHFTGTHLTSIPYRFQSLAEWRDGAVIRITDPQVQAMAHATTIPIPGRGAPHLGFAPGSATGNEDLLYSYGPYPPFGAGDDVQAAFNHCVAYTFATRLTLHSPVAMLLSDGHGGQVGITAHGKAVDTVPGAVIHYTGTHLTDVVLPAGLAYKGLLTGIGSGRATLVVQSNTARRSTTRVFNFAVHRNQHGAFASRSPGPGSITFAGKRIAAQDGVGLIVAGVPRAITARRATRITLVVKDQFRKPARAVTVTIGRLHYQTDGHGRLRLTVTVPRSGTIRLTLSGGVYQTTTFLIRVR